MALVLVADADESCRETVCWTLRAQGYRAIGAATRDAVRWALSIYPTTLLILDASVADPQVMPFVEEARRRSVASRELLVLFTTSANGPAPTELAVLRKPFRAEQLAQLTDALLGQAARRRTTTAPTLAASQRASNAPDLAAEEARRGGSSRSVPGDEPR
jgi:DNA-binding response OmpR family regulator